MIRNALIVSIRFTLFTAVLLGILYPLAITGFAHIAMRNKADGQLIVRDGKVIGSRILAQSFTSDKYFHSRPSAAGNGYDATASGGSNLAQSSQKLVTRIQGDIANAAKENPAEPIPIDMVTTSGSGLDPDLSPESALFQVRRVAAARKLSEDDVRRLVTNHIQKRQLGIMGEPRVNVLELNLALDEMTNPVAEQ
jgi:potassium-transporting ATPase KdpC subunit